METRLGHQQCDHNRYEGSTKASTHALTSLFIRCWSSFRQENGFHVIYDREVPFELRVQESSEGPQQVGTLEAIKVKMLVLVRSVLISIIDFLGSKAEARRVLT